MDGLCGLGSAGGGDWFRRLLGARNLVDGTRPSPDGHRGQIRLPDANLEIFAWLARSTSLRLYDLLHGDKYGWLLRQGCQAGVQESAPSGISLCGASATGRRDRRRCGYGFGAIAAASTGGPDVNGYAFANPAKTMTGFG
jgi:hypothetical protein